MCIRDRCVESDTEKCELLNRFFTSVFTKESEFSSPESHTVGSTQEKVTGECGRETRLRLSTRIEISTYIRNELRTKIKLYSRSNGTADQLTDQRTRQRDISIRDKEISSRHNVDIHVRI